jgi:NhaP-type Na+/H+ or K+/H+ antiporter
LRTFSSLSHLLALPVLLVLGYRLLSRGAGDGARVTALAVLGLIDVDHASDLPGESTIRLAVMATVLLSIFLHGLTAMPGIRRYARAAAALGPEAPEHRQRELRPVQGPP